MMQPDDLRCFWALTERHNQYSDAAQDMGVTPTVLLGAIKALEQHLGARLLEVSATRGVKRDSRPVRLTRAGEVLKAGLPRLFAARAQLIDQVRAAGDPLLRIAFSSANLLWETKAIARLRQPHAPLMAYAIARAPLARQRVGLRQNEFDAGLSQQAGSDQDWGLTVEPAWRDALVAVLPQTHLLASEEKLSLSLLSRYPLGVDKHSEGYGEQIHGLLQAYGAADPAQGLGKAAQAGELIPTALGADRIRLASQSQWSRNALMAPMTVRPIVDETRGEPLWLTTYLRRPLSINPVLTELMAQLQAQLANEVSNSTQDEAGIVCQSRPSPRKAVQRKALLAGEAGSSSQILPNSPILSRDFHHE